MDGMNSPQCTGGDTLIFSCSGAADVGAISDQAARRLTREGKGKMFCLAGIGGRVPGIVDKTKAASCILAIDGCSLDCVKKTLEQAGFTRFGHVRITDLGMEKGKAPATDQNIALVVETAGPLLG